MNEITQSTLLQSMRNNVSMMGHEQTFHDISRKLEQHGMAWQVVAVMVMQR